MHSRSPNSTGRAPKGRGRLEELTGGLGREVEAPAEEIGGEGQSFGSVSLGRWCRGEEEIRGAVRCKEGVLGLLI
jgi:hypothetical protein